MNAMAHLEKVAASLNIYVWRTLTRSDGQAALVMEVNWSETSASYINFGWYESIEMAAEMAAWNLENFGMNLFKETKIFPNIKPQMLKAKPVTLVMSGHVKIVDLKDDDQRVEIFFSGSDKSAILNRNQTLRIVEMYGPETDDWKDKPITLYAEEGKWFGKWQWGLRVVNYDSKNPDENGAAFGIRRPSLTAKNQVIEHEEKLSLEVEA